MQQRRFARRIMFAAGLLLLSLFVGWPVYNTGVLSIVHEEVRIRSGDVELAATISLPRRGNGPFPALVSVHGSGPIRRQDLRADWRRLVPHGIVVLTYDKRGVGESSGQYGEVPVARSEEYLKTLAADAHACFEFLKKHPRVEAQKVGFLGGSQAGWIIPLAADGRDDIAFNIILAGAATSCGIEDHYSLLTGDGHRPVQPLSAEEIERRLQAYDGPIGFDPLPILTRMKTPTLWFISARDLSIPATRSARTLEELRQQGVPLTVKVYPNGDHGLQDVVTRKRLPYWEDTVEWMKAQKILPR